METIKMEEAYILEGKNLLFKTDLNEFLSGNFIHAVFTSLWRVKLKLI